MGARPEVFVGRSEEVALLDSLLEQALAGAGQLILLTGEPGIGKSRLAEEVSRRAQVAGWLTTWGRSWEGPGTPAYWPWIQLLRGIGDSRSDELLAPAAATGDAEHGRFVVFDRVARALHAVAAQHPLLLVLDDIHAADVASLMLLQFVARGLRGNRVLLIAAARDASFVAPAQTYPLLAQVAREARHLPLERLARSDVSDWVTRTAAAVEVDQLFAVTEGNPLYVEELLAAARKRPEVRVGAGPLPLGIREAMRAHLALVSEPALTLLEIASVLGRELPLSLLEAVAAPHELEALDETLASDILRDVGEGRLRFSHMLLRDELYARLGDDRRRALHRRAAQATIDRATAAHHALLGARADDAGAAVAPVHAAMREASGQLAHEDAARLGQRALELLETHLTQTQICELLVTIAEALVLAGDLPGGQAMGQRAAGMAAELGLPDLLARAALTRAAEITFGGDAIAAGWLRRALQALPEHDSPMRARLMARLAVSIRAPATMPERRLLRDGAVAMARRLHDEPTLLAVLHNAGGAFRDELSPRERFALYAETVDLAERIGTVGRISSIFPWHVVSWLELGEPAGARAAAERAERLLAPYTRPHYRWRLPLVRALVAAIAGRFAEAERLSRESLAISREHGLVDAMVMHAIYASSLPYITGEESGLGELVPAIEPLARLLPHADVFRAMWEAPLGRVERVRASIELLKTLPIEDVVGAHQLGWACVRVGLAEHAEYFYQLLRQVPPHNLLCFGPFGCPGPFDLLRGQLASLTRRRDEAAQCFERAAAFARELESPPFVAHAELGWAELLAAADPHAAATHARLAVEAARSVGMATIAARAEKLVGSAPRPAHPSPQQVSLRRDGDVWTLEANGRKLTLLHSKGMSYLEMLMRSPHCSVHALELSGVGDESDAGPQLDATARRAYRTRAEELRAELEEAAAWCDIGRRERAQRELEMLGAELARALGLGGRERRAGSAAERARINVQRRLREVQKRIAEQDEALGRHFELSLKTGLFCMYAPTWPAS